MKKLISTILIGLNLIVLSPVFADTYLSERQSYATKLRRLSPSPQPYAAVTLPENVKTVTYSSGRLNLKAWLAYPDKRQAPYKVIVFFHGGFAFDNDDYSQVKPFLDAGYAVMLPLLRGENGNAGNFELFYGEVDDALAAVNWVSKQSDIDAKHIAVFGHSVGGAIAELTSLWDVNMIWASGSVGALYPTAIFQYWQDIAPFDISDKREVRLRSFIANLNAMKRQHFAYVGSEEHRSRDLNLVKANADLIRAPLKITIVPGDHGSSVPAAINKFLQELKKLQR